MITTIALAPGSIGVKLPMIGRGSLEP